MRKKHLNLFDGRFISEVRPSVVARSALTGSVDNDLLQCEKTVSTSDPLFAASRAVFASVMTRLEWPSAETEGKLLRTKSQTFDSSLPKALSSFDVEDSKSLRAHGRRCCLSTRWDIASIWQSRTVRLSMRWVRTMQSFDFGSWRTMYAWTLEAENRSTKSFLISSSMVVR